MDEAVISGFYKISSLYPNSEVTKFVNNRHIRNKHKHEAIPVFKLRKFIDKEL
jgi:hypothetical protein